MDANAMMPRLLGLRHFGLRGLIRLRCCSLRNISHRKMPPGIIRTVHCNAGGAARHISTKAAVALLLTFTAGCVDVIGYLNLFHTFTANMTGETVHLGEHLVGRHWANVTLAGGLVAAFLMGSILGRALIEVGSRRRMRSVATWALLLEAILITAVGLRTSELPPTGALVMLAAAMGLQTATLTRVGSLTVHTTFVTGMLNKLAQLLSHGAFLTYDLLRGRPTADRRSETIRQARFIFSIWLLYLTGAATGAWMNSAWGLRSLLLPVLVVLLTIIVDQIAPLSIEEERDQSER